MITDAMMWSRLRDVATELSYDSRKPALQELYFEGIELLAKPTLVHNESDKWDNRRK